jgi:hypothetical protein
LRVLRSAVERGENAVINVIHKGIKNTLSGSAIALDLCQIRETEVQTVILLYGAIFGSRITNCDKSVGCASGTQHEYLFFHRFCHLEIQLHV